MPPQLGDLLADGANANLYLIQHASSFSRYAGVTAAVP
jgi:hypothetical protein